MKQEKSFDKRNEEVLEIIYNLNANHIMITDDGVRDFFKIVNEFKKNGTYWEGKIDVKNHNKRIQGFLTNVQGRKSIVRMFDHKF